MKRWIFVLLVLILFSVGTIYGQGAYIFYVNLYSEEVDVRLGDEDDYVFRMMGLEAFSSTYILETADTGSYKLYFKLSTDDEWFYWVDDDEYAYNCTIEDGGDYCILIGWDGRPEFFELNESGSSAPKVCFLNGSQSELTRMEVGYDWRNETQAYANDLSTNTITNFVDVDKGMFSLFWQFPQQKEYDQYYFYPDSSGEEPDQFNFRSNNYYLFMAYTVGRTDYAVLYNITPQ